MKCEYYMETKYLLISSYVISSYLRIINNKKRILLTCSFNIIVNSFNSLIIHTFAHANISYRNQVNIGR